MTVAVLIGALAFVLAVAIVVVAIRKHQSDDGLIQSWSDVVEAFNTEVIRDARRESALLSDPVGQESDVRVGELLELSEEGTGYVRPHDLLAGLGGRD